MKNSILKNFYSFDFYKGLILTLFLGFLLTIGIKTNHFAQAFTIVLGVMFPFFATIEGAIKPRIRGMFVALFLGIADTFIVLSVQPLSPSIYLSILTVLLFGNAFLAVFGYRGSMVAFAGLFALVTSFSYSKLGLGRNEIAFFHLSGGLSYIVVVAIFQLIVKNRTIELLLAETIELTANYLDYREKLNWDEGKDALELQNKLLKTQSIINEKHEMLRVLLLNKSHYNASLKFRKYYLFFLELINIYEMAIGKSVQPELWQQELGNYFDKTQVFRKISENFIQSFYELADAFRYRKAYKLDNTYMLYFREAESTIAWFVKTVTPPKAREGALLMRNLFDYEMKQFQRLSILDKIYNQVFEGDFSLLKRSTSTLFITEERYDFTTLRSNFTLKSTIFRHSLRLTIAVLLAFAIGNLLQQAYTNWIVITVIVILRPNYGLTKSRLKNRIVGTLWGAMFAILVIFFIKNTYVYGSLAILATLVGFTYIQKNYKIAAACITIGILFLYAVINENPMEVIIFRIVDTLIGAAISFVAIYTIFPSWEITTIQEFAVNAIDANRNYLEHINVLYHSKEEATLSYKLVRKEAFLANGNLNAAFQRLTEEPKSKRHQLSNWYSIVLLNHTILTSAAALSAYIQTHTTTSPSENFDIVMKYCLDKLNNAIELFQGMELSPTVSTSQLIDSQEVLLQNYNTLHDIRNKEWEEAHSPMSLEMRARLQEGKLIINQLNDLVNLTEQLIGMVKIVCEEMNTTKRIG